MAADRIEAYIDNTFEIGEFIQAQAGELDGLITADQWRNAYGAHYVPIDPNREDSGATATFTIKNVAEAGTYDLHLRYASDEEENRNEVTNNGNAELTLLVNGSERKLTPAFTDYWDDWDIHTVSIDLEAGDNTVAIELSSNDVGGLNINTIGVTEQNSAPPFPATYTDFEDRHTENENYDTEPEFDFIKQVPTSWDETTVVDAAIGEYIVVARRSGEEWFLGAMTNGTARDLTVPLDEFLTTQDNGWSITEYTDAPGAGVDSNPTEVDISNYRASATDSVGISMGASGGTAMYIQPADSPSVTVAEFHDPEGDDYGPGSYTYPTNGAFQDGAFDLRSFRVLETEEEYRFAFEVENLYDTFGGDFSPHYFLVYLRDPDATGGRTDALEDLNLTAEFDQPWQYRIDASGFGKGITDANGESLGTPEVVVSFESNTAVVSIPKSVVGGDIANWEAVPIVGSEDQGTLRPVAAETSSFGFGGAREGAADEAPRIVDLITPEGVSQAEALDYDADSLASLPFTPL